MHHAIASTHRMWRIVCTAAALLLAASVWAQTGAAPSMPLLGQKTIWLGNAAGERIAWGTIRFEPQPGGALRFSISPSDALREHFLAMRPFKCLAGARERLCWFPYTKPPQQIVGDDFGALELALMFLHTKPAALHVNSANGIYYRIQRSSAGLRGVLHDVDMDPIVVPQGDPMRPIRPAMLHTADPNSRWLPILSIE